MAQQQNKKSTAVYRRRLKENEPEKYKEVYLNKAKERYQKLKEEREAYWATGTRDALCHKEAYEEKRRYFLFN